MALKNKDLLFVIKVRNQARAALSQIKGDLRGVGQAAQAGSKGIRSQEQALERLRKKAVETARALRSIASAGGGSRGAAGGRGATAGGRGTTDLAALARAARSAATNLDRVARSRAGRQGGAGGRGSPAAAGEIDTRFRGLATAALRATTALEKLARGANAGRTTRPAGGGAGGGAVAGAAAGRGIGLGALLSVGAATLAIRTYATLSDEYKNLFARITLTTTGLEEQQATFGRIVSIANNTRQSLEGTVTTYFRLSQAAQQLGLEQEDAFVSTELIAKAITISGAASEAANAAIIQLGQGLASGTLRGDELRSVLEQTPRLAQAIAEGMGTTVGQLRVLGQEGKITAETVISAILTQRERLESEFAQFPVTLGQALTVLRTSATVAIGEIEQSTGVTAGFAQAIQNLGLFLQDPAIIEGLKDIVQIVGTGLKIAMAVAIAAFKAFIVLLPAFKVGLVLLITNFIRLRLAAIATAIAVRGGFAGMVASVIASMRAMAVAVATNPFGALLTALGALIGLMIVFSDSTVQVAGQQIALGDIVTETFSTIVDAVGDAVTTISENWSWMSGNIQNDTENTTTTGLAYFAAFADNVINLFLVIGQSIGIIIANILGDIAKVGAAGAALLSGDFSRAAELAGSTRGVSGTAADLAQNAQRQFSQNYAGGILQRAAQRTANAQQTPLGGIAQPGAGGNPAGSDAAGDAAKRAKELADRFKQLQSTYDEFTSKQREFNDNLNFLTGLLALGDSGLRAYGTTVAEVTRVRDNLLISMREELDINNSLRQSVGTLTRLMGVGVNQREEERRVIELQTEARRRGFPFIEAETRALIRQEAALTALDAARTEVATLSNTAENELAGLGLIGAARDRAIAQAEFLNNLARENNGILTEEMRILGEQFAQQQQITAAIAARNDLTDRLTSIETEIRLSGVLEQSRDRVNSLLEYENYLREQGLLGTQQGVELMRTYTEAVNAATAAEQAARRDWRSGIQEGLTDLTEEWGNFRNQARGFVTDTFQSLSDSLTGFLETGKLSFSSFVQGIGKSLIKIGVNGLLGQATGALNSLFGDRGQVAGQPTSILDRYLQANRAIPVMVQNAGGLGALLQPGAANDNVAGAVAGLVAGNDNATSTAANTLVAGAAQAASIFQGGIGEAAVGFGGILQSLLGGAGGGGASGLFGIGLNLASSLLFKDGGIMTEHGKLPLRKYSGGGIARSPQLAMFGEGSTPEAYVPVPSGRIPVEMKGQGMGGSVTNVNMTVVAQDAGSFNKSRGQIAAEMGAEISRQSRRNN